jgi:hypothetical protein
MFFAHSGWVPGWIFGWTSGWTANSPSGRPAFTNLPFASRWAFAAHIFLLADCVASFFIVFFSF